MNTLRTLLVLSSATVLTIATGCEFKMAPIPTPQIDKRLEAVIEEQSLIWQTNNIRINSQVSGNTTSLLFIVENSKSFSPDKQEELRATTQQFVTSVYATVPNIQEFDQITVKYTWTSFPIERSFSISYSAAELGAAADTTNTTTATTEAMTTTATTATTEAMTTTATTEAMTTTATTEAMTTTIAPQNKE